MTKTTLAILLLLSLSYGGKAYLEQTGRVKEPSAPNLKPLLAAYQGTSLENHALGFNSFLGALLWVQLLQKSNYRPVTSDEVTWEYAQADAITTLDPNNDRAYRYGAVFLSVLRRDKLGGRLFIEKWVRKHPNEWRPTYMLGSHYFLELKDYAAAAPLILRASVMREAPQWMSSLGIRLLSSTGALYPAFKISIDLASELSDGEALDRMKLRIRSLNYNLQKQNWEEALKSYRNEKKRRPLDLAELVPYATAAMRSLASVAESTEIEASLRQLIEEFFPFRYDSATDSIQPLDPIQIAELEQIDVYDEPGSQKRAAKKKVK